MQFDCLFISKGDAGFEDFDDAKMILKNTLLLKGKKRKKRKKLNKKA